MVSVHISKATKLNSPVFGRTVFTSDRNLRRIILPRVMHELEKQGNHWLESVWFYSPVTLLKIQSQMAKCSQMINILLLQLQLHCNIAYIEYW